jgi:adenosylmethionine-8-amino-7-oxononanoate aminotransferase
MKDWIQSDIDHVWHPFTPMAGKPNLLIKKAKGIYLYTHDGRKIMDMISSWWVNIHGHANPNIAKAIARQAYELEQVIFAGFTHKPAIKLAKSLLKLLPENQNKLFFSDDGSTAVEVALKLAIQFWYNKGSKKTKIIAIEGAYHGDTFGAMSVGGRSLFNKPFDKMMFDVAFVPFPIGDGANAINAMKKLADKKTAAFIFEPLVQGAAGMRMYTPTVLDELIKVAKTKEIVCIADEVMTGFGRTGKIFACDYLENKPDIFCLSKGLTAGFLPMGITSISKDIVDCFSTNDINKTFFHGHSYTANPMACAAANASLKLLTSKKVKNQIARISENHLAFIPIIAENKSIAEVKSTGTILSIKITAKDSGYASSLKEKIYGHFLGKNILLRPLGNVIYLIPPYIITDDELDLVYKEIKQFIDQLSI